LQEVTAIINSLTDSNMVEYVALFSELHRTFCMPILICGGISWLSSNITPFSQRNLFMTWWN